VSPAKCPAHLIPAFLHVCLLSFLNLPSLPARFPLLPVRFELTQLILVSSLPEDSLPRLWTVTNLCTLPKQGVLLLKLWLSILIILVQAQLLGHAPTTIPPTQYAFMMVSTPSMPSRAMARGPKFHQHWEVC
jgi:hypothetical protein